MRRGLILVVGVLIGQWLAYAGTESPSTVYRLAHEAWERSDWQEAARQWSRAVSREPDNVYFNYMRAAALARLGHRHAAADALQLTLLMEPAEPLAGQIRHELAGLTGPVRSDGAVETLVPLEAVRGVWVASLVVNGRHRGRFLVDTGSSITVFAPAFAAMVGAKPRAGGTLEIETLGGRTRGPWAAVASLRLGAAEIRNTDVVIHPPGGDLDGILGNSFLNHWDVSLDPDRRTLRLRRPASSSDAVSASPR